MLADEQASPEQLAIFRQMTPERRLSLAEQLYWSARELKAAWAVKPSTLIGARSRLRVKSPASSLMPEPELCLLFQPQEGHQCRA